MNALTRGTVIRTWCWNCGAETLRNGSGRLYEACTLCGRHDVHVTPSLAASTHTASDLAAMAKRGRRLIEALRSAPVDAKTVPA